MVYNVGVIPLEWRKEEGQEEIISRMRGQDIMEQELVLLRRRIWFKLQE
jgi:hypothetical protein